MFHTICTFLSVIGKRFQDAGLRDVIIESGVISEGSVFGVRTYNHAIRFHKLMYEALKSLCQHASHKQRQVAQIRFLSYFYIL